MKTFLKSLVTVAVASSAISAQAGQLSVWDSSWTQFDNSNFSYRDFGRGGAKVKAIKDNTVSTGSRYHESSIKYNAANYNTNDNNYTQTRQYQAYDAEYLFYKFDQNTKQLSVGLQTGFDLITGKHRQGHITNYVGDMKLSFGQGKSYALDFGLETRTQGTNYRPGHLLSNSNDAGIYEVQDGDWNTNTFHSNSYEWASDKNHRGPKIELEDESVGSGITRDQYTTGGGVRTVREVNNKSYFRTATFDMTKILGTNFDFSQGFSLGASWTMSCYNDVIHGMVPKIRVPHVITPVSEPASIALFGLGLVGLGIARKKAKAKAA